MSVPAGTWNKNIKKNCYQLFLSMNYHVKPENRRRKKSSEVLTGKSKLSESMHILVKLFGSEKTSTLLEHLCFDALHGDEMTWLNPILNIKICTHKKYYKLNPKATRSYIQVQNQFLFYFFFYNCRIFCRCFQLQSTHTGSKKKCMDLNEVNNSMQLRIRWSNNTIQRSNMLSECAEWLILKNSTFLYRKTDFWTHGICLYICEFFLI